MPDSSTATVTVAIATCGRPAGLHATLDSVAQQVLPPETAVRVVVVDNHRLATAADVVAEAQQKGFPYPLAYAHEPEPGISFARNRLVHMAHGSVYVAFIDDDEVASPGWLGALLEVARRCRVNVVLGPVEPRVERGLDRAGVGWMRPLFERPRHPDGALLVGAADFRTSNVLIRRALLDDPAGPFDPEFALLGGSDTLLGQQLWARGERFAWADQAVVVEHVSGGRLRPSWFLKRRFRAGVVFTRVNRRLHGPLRGALPSLRRGLGSIAVGELNLLRGLPRGRLPVLDGAGLIAYGAGALSGLFGHVYHEYRGRSG